MKTLADILNAAALRGGLPKDHPELVQLLTNADVARIEVPEALQKSLEGLGEINQEAARQNLELKKYFRKEVLDGMDERLSELAEVFGSEMVSKLKAENSTFQKPALFKEAIKRLKEEAKQAKKDGDDTGEAEAKKQISELNRKLAEYEQTYVPQSKLEELKSGYEQQLLDSFTYSLFAGQSWSEQYSPKHRGMLAKAALEEELAAVGGKLILKDGKPKLVNAQDTSLDLYVNHQPINPDQIVSQVMTKNKFIAASQSTSVTNGKNGPIVTEGETNTKTANTAFAELSRSSLKDLGINLS